MKRIMSIMAAFSMIGVLVAQQAFADGSFGGAENPACLVAKKDPRSPKLTGTIAVDAINSNVGIADVVMRLTRGAQTKFYRQLLVSEPFTAPSLLFYQARLCEVINNGDFIAAVNQDFSLTATGFVIDSTSIREGQVLPDINGETGGNYPIANGAELAIVGPSGPTGRSINMADVTIYAR